MKRSTLTTLMIASLFALFSATLPQKLAAQSGKLIEDSVHAIQQGLSMDQGFNVPLKTTGGTQLWTDYVDRAGFRIQLHALTGHWRLLDVGDVRQAWGTRNSCDSKLNQLCPANDKAAANHTIVMLHGLMRTRHCMNPLTQSIKKELGKQDPSVRTIRFSYASTRGSIGDHAAALQSVLQSQSKSSQFSFVGHSMGNIIVRHLIGDLQRNGDPNGILPRCRSMVMLGPPNQGAAIARRLAPTKLYGWITGAGGLELGPQWKTFSDNLATPDFPFLIIAGDVSDNTVQNPLVDGSSDFVVSLDEATLEGATAVETFPVLHSFLMNDQAVMKRTVEFLISHAPNPVTP